MTWRVLRALVLPVVVTLVVPALILRDAGGAGDGQARPAPVVFGMRLAGMLLAGLGLTLMVQTIRLFAVAGRGTLVPWDPPRRLVVEGVYRYVRNPMISGVCAILLGESLLLPSGPLFVWFLVTVAVNALYIPLLEEPGLERRFGAEYTRYKKHVPRWIPRTTPWDPAGRERE